MFCPLIRNECREDCVFKCEYSCGIKNLMQQQNIEDALNELSDNVQRLDEILIEAAKRI